MTARRLLPLDVALRAAEADLRRALTSSGVLEYAAALGADPGAGAAYRASLDAVRDAYQELSRLELVGSDARIAAVASRRAELEGRERELTKSAQYGERRRTHERLMRLAPPADCVIEVEVDAPLLPPAAAAAAETGPPPPRRARPGKRKDLRVAGGGDRSRVKDALRKRLQIQRHAEASP